MGRFRRSTISSQVYEISSRVSQGIPFPPSKTMNLLIRSAIARSQRDSKVTVCHHAWMGNHFHMIVIVKDATAFREFYKEFQKTLTDNVKKLLGARRLKLWDASRPMISRLGDAEKVMQRIAYFYANPARADLVDSIKNYPGVSSYGEFEKTKGGIIDATVTDPVPWIRLRQIPKVGRRRLSLEHDRELFKALSNKSTEAHDLTIAPNAWMRCFGFRDEDVPRLNSEIARKLQMLESEARQRRCRLGKKVIGAIRLSTMELMRSHSPEKYQRKVIIMATSRELRSALLEEYYELCFKCKICYEAWRRGEFEIPWPLGAYPPCPPIRANSIVYY